MGGFLTTPRGPSQSDPNGRATLNIHIMKRRDKGMNKKTNNKGFSLVELIIVIAIMAILVGVLAPQFIKYVEKSRESTDVQNVDQIKTAIDVYVADHESASTTAKITITDGSKDITLTGVTATELAEYGISSATLKLKSGEWEDCEIDYSDYKWTYTTNGKAKYYKIDGSEAP